MLCQPMMIRRTLDRKIQRDFKFLFTRSFYQRTKVISRAQLWMYRLVTALCTANGVRAAWIIGSSNKRIVRPLAVAHANRMNGRKIKYVKTHSINDGQALDDIFKGAVTLWIVTRRTRKQ